ncbi:hypothetical protein ACOI1H_26170 [Loktanella sp. DJP18]|uniref:hypothetical protein n=1 Tax=Loktanella sp. DJP18 TaxID=3409788 RepID=UPI003BB4F714
MKSIDHVTFGLSGTARASGTSLFNRLRGFAAAEVYRPRRDQDWLALSRDNHTESRNARATAATRSTGASPGTRRTESFPGSPCID